MTVTKWTIASPWALLIPRKTTKPKRYAMSLNNYRNAHHRVNNNAKKFYTTLMGAKIKKLPKWDRVSLLLTLYPPSHRKVDLDNIGSVTAKFFQDALVVYKRIVDDNYQHVVKLSFEFGKVDAKNPRVDIQITKEETE